MIELISRVYDGITKCIRISRYDHIIARMREVEPQETSTAELITWLMVTKDWEQYLPERTQCSNLFANELRKRYPEKFHHLFKNME